MNNQPSPVASSSNMPGSLTGANNLIGSSLQMFKKTYFLFVFCMLSSSLAFADFSVTTNGGSGLAPTYLSLGAAITALNAATITSPVVITCPTGSETAPAGGYSITAQGTVVNTIIIQGNGAANSIITAASPAGAIGNLNDAIFKLLGADFVTIQGFAMNENPANIVTAAATNNMVEWGVALLHASVTNGAQNNTIQNNTITLNKTNLNTWGIYSNNSHSATTVGTLEIVTSNTTGPASGNKFYTNAISNVNMGIALIGSGGGPNMDIGNDIGGSAAGTGNIISNWGGAAASSTYNFNTATSYCILLTQQIGENVSFNTLTSATISGTSVTLRAIFKFFSVAPTLVGTSSITNNTITITDNFTSGTLECIRTQDVVTATSVCNITNNTILNTSVGGASSSTTIVGIINTSAWGTLNMNSNIIKGTTSTATTGGFTGISNTGVVVTTINMNNNQIGNASGNAITYSVATSGTFTGITNSGGAAAAVLTMNGNNIQGITYNGASSSAQLYLNNSTFTGTTNINTNTFTNLNVNTTGSVTFISNSVNHATSTTHNVNNNQVVTGYTKGGSGGTILFYNAFGSSPASVTEINNGNNFSNLTFTGASIAGWRSADGTTPGSRKTITGNTFNNITNTISGAISSILYVGFSDNTFASNNVSGNIISNISGASTITGIFSDGQNQNFINNSIFALSSSGPSIVSGISMTGATIQNISKNKIYNLSASNAAGSVNGIVVSAGTTFNINNNLIGDLRAPAASGANVLIGLNIGAVTNANVFYNTIYLNSTSSGATFGSSAISASTTPALDLRNNILVNTSMPMGAGLSVAYRRSTTTLGTYAAASNRNDFNASTIFTDGTNTFTAMGPYMVFVMPRDANSISVAPPFLSTVSGNPNFLKIDTAIPTQLESGAANIAGIVDDFENEIRQGNPGYLAQVNGGGTAPDIGADEFDGIPLPVCMGTPIAGSITGASAVCTGTGTTLTLTGATNALGITYQWRSGTMPGGPYPTLLGTSATQATGPLTVPTYYVVDVTCTNPGGSTVTTAEKSVLINPLPIVMVSPSSGSICTPGGTPVTLTASGASTYTWAPTTGLSPTTGAVVAANPASTTTYTVTGTDVNGCINTATATINVTGAPQNVTATATPATICTGTTSNLSSTGYVQNTTAVPNTYSFAGSSATYNAISGIPAGPSAIGDDVGVGNLPIGFTFIYNNIPQTVFAVSSNGLIILGNTSPTISGFSSNALASTANSIAPLWDDNNTTGGAVEYSTTGSSGTRVLTVQWTNMHVGASGNAGQPTISMQLKLYETTGIVQFIYGSTSAPLSSTGASIGISGVSGNFISVTPLSPPNTSTTSTVTENSTISSAVNFPSGTTYTFTPPSLPLTFAWSPAGLVVNPTSQNTATTPLASTTTFTVTVSNGGCSSTASATVTIVPLTCNPPVASSPLCANSNFTLTAQPVGGGAPYMYTWSDGVGGVYPNAQIITANLPAGMYTFTATVTDNCGSICTSNVAVTINALPAIFVNPPTSVICNPGGSPVTLTASGASTYTWNPTTGLTPTTGSPVSANPSSTTTYTVTGTDVNGCANTASATVNVAAAVIVNSVTVSPSPVCPGQTATLTANASFATPTYCASTHSSGSCQGDEINLVVLNTLSNPSGCVVAPSYSDFTLIPPTTLSVGGSPYTLSVTMGSDGTQFAAAWIDYNQDGTFNSTTEFIGTSANVGANGTANFIFSVPGTAINGLTRLRIIGGNDIAITSSQFCGASSNPFGETEDYTVNISGATIPFTYLWSPALYVSSTTTNPTTQLAIPTNTTFFVTVTSPSGCTASGSVTQTLYTPTVVSGPSSICINSTAQYLPSSGGTWSASNGNATITNAGLATGVTAGSVIFTFTDGMTGCSSSTPLVNILPVPSSTITASMSIYQGSTGNIASVPSAGAGATYAWTLSSGMITNGAGTNTITYTAGTPPSMLISVTVTSQNGCSSSSNKTVTVLIPGTSTMTWVPDNQDPPSCGPSSNCCHDTLCFNLKYTPGVTGLLTTYTTGFFINCLGGFSPIGYNKSCIKHDNSFQISQCALIDSVLFNSSGNDSIDVPVTQAVPIILHKICLNIATNESVQIREDNITNLSASIDQAGSGHLTEFPTYTTQTFSKPAPVIPSNITVNINCPGDTLFPVTPPVVDFCGNPITPTLVSRVNIPNPLTCEGTKKYNFMYTDCSGFAQPWSFTYDVEYLDFTIAAPPGGSIVACPSLSNIVPTPPVIVDHCGKVLTPTYTDSGPPACEGFRFYVFTYTDCEGNTHNWVYAYVVEYEPIPNPTDVTVTVACPLLANVVPTPPAVLDNCGMLLTPSGPTSTPALTAETCEGTRTFTWTYIDCEGNTQDFNYTYIVERDPFNNPPDGGSTVACPALTNTVPAPPPVVDNCGTPIMPTGPVVSPIPACEGSRTYTYLYTDCEGNTQDYVYTYTIVRPPFILPADQNVTVSCPEASNVVPVAPTVVDACGITLIPVDTVSTAPVSCQGVDALRTYTFTFTDCAGHTLNWTYTYTVRCFPLTLKVILQGAYDVIGDTMRTSLNTNHILPGQDKMLSPNPSIQFVAPYTPFGQPYNTAPWNYNGNTGMQYGDPSSPGAPPGVIPYPLDVVDWVLVTVRKNGILPANNFWTCAGWVHKNGDVTFPEPCGGLVYTPTDSMYVMVQHRTHLGVLSPFAAKSTCTTYIKNWDFTTSNSYQPFFRYGERLVEPGVWAMHAANGDQITSIAAIGSADLTAWRAFQNAYGYNIGDYNMNGQAESGGDETLWKLNQNRTSGIIFY
ncbi:MAG: GEVED domain-containing protein [Saprospiraceae bacterium]